MLGNTEVGRSPQTFLEEEEDWERLCLEQARREARETSPVHGRFRRAHFVSRSKGWRNGKQRLRRNWVEVELVQDMAETSRRWRSWNLVAFDDKGSEVYPFL